jgi:hypothetical protein
MLFRKGQGGAEMSRMLVMGLEIRGKRFFHGYGYGRTSWL